MILHKRFKAERVAKGKTQQEVADMLGITRVSYQNKENGKAFFTLAEFDKITKFLEIDRKELYIFFD